MNPILRQIAFFLAVYLLNCSVDAPDAGRHWCPENLNYNEQESLVELIVEKVLGFEKAIPEYDDTDCADEVPMKKSNLVDWFVLPVFQTSCCLYVPEPETITDHLPENPLPVRARQFSPPPEI